MVIEIDVNTDYKQQHPNFFGSLGYNDYFEWKCSNCGTVHVETEYRNFQRRKIKCSCQYNLARCKEVDNKLKQVNYSFLYQEDNAFSTNKSGTLNLKKPILVKCLSCGKISKEFYYNILKDHKKCNCREDKKFTRNISAEEFIQKWPELNQRNFELLDDTFLGRNNKYHIRCKNCGREDIKWGITLIDSIVCCKYCDNGGSKNEQLISMLLDKKNIHYIREYAVIYNGHNHRFDFYLPEKQTMIEYNGQQHYKPIDFFGGEEQFKLRQDRDKEKQQFCEENNLKLIIFNYKQTSKDIEEQIGIIFND